MTNKPLVSVITIFLNAERFIREAIESLFAQSYRDWELLLVDDGSTDRSTHIARAYASEHGQRVRYLEHADHKNRGMSASQNLGIKEAKGEYIAFLDADDVWTAEKLEEQVMILKAHTEAAMVYGNTKYWYSWTGKAEDANRDLLIKSGVHQESLIKPPELLVRLLRQEIPVPCPSDVMVRRDAAINVGGFEESFRRIFTDQVFYAKLCLKHSAFVADRTWFKYRKHPDSAVSLMKKTGQLSSARLTYLRWLEGYLDKHQIKDREVSRALKSARWKCRHPKFFQLAAHARYRALIAGELFKSIARQTLPAPVYRRLRPQRENRIEQPR